MSQELESDKMADAESSSSSSSRYLKTSPPVLSTEYKRVLKTVNENRRTIEDKSAELKNMKSKLEELQLEAVQRLQTQVEEQEEQDHEVAEVDKLSPRFGSTIRKSIVTPGGHKRKVKPAHEKFKFELKDALSELVTYSPGEELIVDDLMDLLQSKYPAVKRIEQSKILSEISKLYNTKMQRRGKKRQRFYKDLLLCEVVREASSATNGNATSSTESPVRKTCRNEISELTESEPEFIEYASYRSSCRTQLDFTDPSTSDVEPIEFSQMEKTNEVLEEEIKRLEEKLANYQEISQEVISKQAEVIELYEEIVGAGNLLGGILSISERQAIKTEVKKAKEIFDLHIRSKGDVIDLLEIVDPLLFTKLLQSLRDDCPTIVNVLEQLVLSENASRNKRKTEHMKMTAAIHLLSSLLDVRDQNGKNDIQILFGLLCISYGAGSNMIGVLQRIGLCESFQFLCSLLKQQLKHYKALIKKRVPASIPIITYQDNMQLKRTSLRHLRLSKLQQEKAKQNKFWDFTVRGWREADISGIEDLFTDEKTANKPQKDVDKLKYEDIKIESHKEHAEKWADFKQRNLLRKMNLVFNTVSLDADEIKNATSEELKEISEENNKPILKIEVPLVPEEFPELSTKKTATCIYPLPLSYENQCKTLGLGRNLEMFSDEFDFKCKQEKKFLPQLKSKRQFNLQLSYERYAFLKSMDKHKARQSEYESFLRNK